MGKKVVECSLQCSVCTADVCRFKCLLKTTVGFEGLDFLWEGVPEPYCTREEGV